MPDIINVWGVFNFPTAVSNYRNTQIAQVIKNRKAIAICIYDIFNIEKMEYAVPQSIHKHERDHNILNNS